MNPEAFLGPKKICKMELFAEKVPAVHYFCKKRYLRCSGYVLNTEYCYEHVSGSVNYFRKELHLRCVTGF